MALTFGDLLNDIEGQLYSYGMQRDKVTTLTQAISATDTTLVVADAAQVDRGFVEVDQELMAVAAPNRNTSTITLHPWGRGQRGTVAAAHSANTKVTISPRFPRSAIARVVQRTVASCYPDLYQVKVDQSAVAAPTRTGYPLPADADSIISISYELPYLQGQWQRVNRWRLNQNAGNDGLPSDKRVDIYESILPGRPIRVVYRTGFGSLVSESDTLGSIGLQDRWGDLITYGSVGNLLLSMESTRLESDTVETQERAAQTTVTQSTTVARQLLGMFKQRIMEERSLLHRQHPPVMTRTY